MNFEFSFSQCSCKQEQNIMQLLFTANSCKGQHICSSGFALCGIHTIYMPIKILHTTWICMWLLVPSRHLMIICRGVSHIVYMGEVLNVVYVTLAGSKVHQEYHIMAEQPSPGCCFFLVSANFVSLCFGEFSTMFLCSSGM